MEGGKGVVGIRDLFRWVGDGRESSSGQKGGGTKDLAVLELLFPGPWVTGGGRDERPRRSPLRNKRYLETLKLACFRDRVSGVSSFLHPKIQK